MRVTKLIKSTFLAAAFLYSGADILAQTGEDCGCPPVSSRNIVNVSTLTDANDNLLATSTWTCDNLYRLDRRIYVQDGQTLTIQPGTVVKGVSNADVLDVAALIVTRGGELIAKGSESCQIIFTAEDDNVDGLYPVLNTEKWGGIIMLGKASNNLLETDGLGICNGLGTIEGLDIPDPRHHYGANLNGCDADQDPGTPDPVESFDDNDSSGHLEWVSIRHGGTVIGADNEINGLTLGSVGRGTTLEHIEVVSNGDDGIEFFGGTADMRYASVYFCKDDYIDWDHGYTGRIQFVLGVQHPANNSEGNLMGDNGFEMDSDDSNSSQAPFSNATVYNATIIGNGSDIALEAKERTNGSLTNSIFANFSTGLNLDDDRAIDAVDNFLNGTFSSNNNCFIAMGTDLTVGGAAPAAGVTSLFVSSGNDVIAAADSPIDYEFVMDETSNAVTDVFNPVPSSAASVATDQGAPTDGWFCAANYKGAFAPGEDSWAEGGYMETLGLDVSVIFCPTDINRDGRTNSEDFAIFLGNFNLDCGQ